jgi:hypothetical protein
MKAIADERQRTRPWAIGGRMRILGRVESLEASPNTLAAAAKLAFRTNVRRDSFVELFICSYLKSVFAPESRML